MLYAVIALALAAAASDVGLVLLARWFKTASDERVLAMRMYTDTRDMADRYMDERDEALQKLAASDLSRRALIQRVEQLERDRNAAYNRAVEDVRHAVANSSVADAAAAVDRILSTALPGLSSAVPAAAAGGSGTAAGAVQPAQPAAADDAGGH
jgi:hypothetical protein